MSQHKIARHRFRRDQSTSDSASASSSSFFISDTSPLFSYGLLGGLGDSSSPWTAGYARQSDGYDETLHLSSTTNSTVAFNVTASSLSLLVPSFDNCQATISINSSYPISACSIPVSSSSSEVIPFTLYNLPQGLHNVLWNSGTIPIGEQVIFWGIDGIRPIEKTGFSNVTIDDSFVNSSEETNVGIRFEGDWTHLSSDVHSDALSESSKLDGDYNNTLAITQKTASAVTFFGTGSAIYLYGMVGPDYGSASISLNGQMVAPNLNFTSPWQMPYELLWFQTGLDSSQANQVTMTNLGNKKTGLDFVILTSDSDTISRLVSGESDDFLSSLKGKIIMGTAIPLTIIILLSLLTIWICCQKRSSRRRRHSRDSTAALRPPTRSRRRLSYQFSEKPYGTNKTTSARSVSSFDDVFVSYDEALRQRMSDRWQSPTSPSNSAGTGRAAIIPRTPASASASPGNGNGTNSTGLSSVPENMVSSPERVRSLLGSQYAATNPPDSRRGTALPAYTPEGTYVTVNTTTNTNTNGNSPVNAYETLTGTGPSSNISDSAETLATTNPNAASPMTRYPTAEEEKRAQLALFKTFDADSNASPNSSISRNDGPSGLHRTPTSGSERERGGMSRNRSSSNAPSDIMSIFGTAPGSEGRLSSLTDWTSNSPFNIRPESRMSSYPYPPQPINQTAPLKIPSPNSGRIALPSSSGNRTGNGSGHPIRPKVDMTFLTTSSKSSGHSHPFLVSPSTTSAMTRNPSTTGKSSSKMSNGLPSSWSANTPQSSSTGEYSHGNGIPQRHRRNQSAASAWTERSAARPDSEVMPFENFMSGLQVIGKEEHHG
ncbi:uncharacterized protein IL334_006109 [Kwoniella shivajii]|uniref:Uncharacterized protein n=1 Tax=Kwoniella shivajii TaxID=564305 RepID=A0ABZ1D6X0_9TREE|nr:hypothetical protein IL334_006109 [Kwoniella shivajii]